MRVSVDTIQRGWGELVDAGWLELRPLPASRRREQGALKVLRWPANELPAGSGHVELPADSTYPLTAAELPAGSGPTFPGNQESLRASQRRTTGEQRGEQEAAAHVCNEWDAWDVCVGCGAYRFDMFARSYAPGEMELGSK